MTWKTSVGPHEEMLWRRASCMAGSPCEEESKDGTVIQIYVTEADFSPAADVVLVESDGAKSRD